MAYARVEGSVVGVTLEAKGDGFVSPPTITVLGGSGAEITPTMRGYVSSITVTKSGDGYTSNPSVTMTGGGGSGASATASVVSGEVWTIKVTDAGSGYTSAPEVKISGGGGRRAEAVANMLFKVDSVTLAAGGSGYPLNPEIVVEGGGGGGVSLTAQVRGHVAEVQVLDRGLYEVGQVEGQGIFPNWPTVTIPGNVKVSASFSGQVHSAEVLGSSNYSSIPTVSFSGGGGSKAAGSAELTWQRSDHERTAKFDNCSAQLLVLPVCFDVSGTKLPASSQVPLPSEKFFCYANHAEGIGWSVRASSSAQFRDDALPVRAVHTTLPGRLFFFEGETVWCRAWRQWFVPGATPLVGATIGANFVRQFAVTYYTRPFFSRVEPDVVYRLLLPDQSGGQNCTLSPTFRQYVDQVGQSFWYLESLAVAAAGVNLFVPPSTTTVSLMADGNGEHVLEQVGMTFTRAAPTFALAHHPDFDPQPEVSVTVVPVGSDGQYQVTNVALASGGQTTLDDGTVQLELLAVTGYWLPGYTKVFMTGTVANGQLSSIAPVSAPAVVGPAAVATVTLPADPFFTNINRVTTGRSLFKTTVSHQAPTVAASCEPQFGGDAAVFSVALEQVTDANGRPVWRVDSVSVESGGSGYNDLQAILFEVIAPGIEAVPAVGVVRAQDGAVVDVEISVGGEYFCRQIAETEEMLPDVSCIGPVSTATEWQRLDRDMLEADFEWFDVNEPFSVTYQPVGGGPGVTNTLSRTRRCDLPTITLELQ